MCLRVDIYRVFGGIRCFYGVLEYAGFCAYFCFYFFTAGCGVVNMNP